MSEILAEYSTSSFFSPHGTALMDFHYFKKRNRTLNDLQEKLDQSMGNKTLVEFFEEISFQCRNQFLLCWFENGHIFDCCNPKSMMHFKRFFIHSGLCFELETNNVTQKVPGPVGGFGFGYWYPNVADLFPTAYNAYDEHGLHVYNNPVEAMLEKNPVVLPVGTHARISIRAMKTTRLLRDQLFRPTCTEQTLKYFQEYSYPACNVECIVDNLIRDHP